MDKALSGVRVIDITESIDPATAISAQAASVVSGIGAHSRMSSDSSRSCLAHQGKSSRSWSRNLSGSALVPFSAGEGPNDPLRNPGLG